jgi:hypothetical protein
MPLLRKLLRCGKEGRGSRSEWVAFTMGLGGAIATLAVTRFVFTGDEDKQTVSLEGALLYLATVTEVVSMRDALLEAEERVKIEDAHAEEMKKTESSVEVAYLNDAGIRGGFRGAQKKHRELLEMEARHKSPRSSFASSVGSNFTSNPAVV